MSTVAEGKWGPAAHYCPGAPSQVNLAMPYIGAWYEGCEHVLPPENGELAQKFYMKDIFVSFMFVSKQFICVPRNGFAS